MKLSALAVGSVLALAGCSSLPRGLAGRTGAIILPDISPKTGGHCESSALMNALDYLGYGVDEATIIGMGAAPSFMFTTEGFPFIGARSSDLREVFLSNAGIEGRVFRPSDETSSWEGVVKALEGGKPVPLRVDMRWLPYRYGGHHGPKYMEFGWHWICLFGLDFDKGLAYVSDTEFPGLQAIKLGDLEKARSSRTKVWPPQREYLVLEPRPAAWAIDSDRAARMAIAAAVGHYRHSAFTAGMPGALQGLERFPSELEGLWATVNRHAFPAAFKYMADTIERNGTGGAAFRRLYHDWLARMSADCTEPGLAARLAAASTAAQAAVEAWHGLSGALEKGAAGLSGNSPEAERKAACTKAAGAARLMVEAERAFLASLEAVL